MPIMDGYETSRKIRNSDTSIKNTQIPIIALTAHVLDGAIEECLEAGMNDYLSKPISINRLRTILTKWLVKELK